MQGPGRLGRYTANRRCDRKAAKLGGADWQPHPAAGWEGLHTPLERGLPGPTSAPHPRLLNQTLRSNLGLT